ncbi:MAG: phycocyanobilin:ferredoxin oxidoreductase [Leptolyngbyaceae cyanobacterium MO_188.B28]|nr:phycocyanobilin:ferredoxin oxidoreductase [Leptolyngbyaceae cyanobacterium MO_188.B28]
MLKSIQATTRATQRSLIQRLAESIEEIWRYYLVLSPYSVPEDLGYIEGSLEGQRLTIQNHCYQTPQFRKLHLELAQIDNGLDILHCVMFPNPEYALPIFGVDLVGSRDYGISAAIADLSPINADSTLPIDYQQALSTLPRVSFSQPRRLPEWGDIFSDHCLFIRPIGASEEDQFLNRALEFLTIHCQIARTETPLSSRFDIMNVIAGQHNYCTKQRQNDKTRRVLEKSFGTEWTNRYMSTMLFDAIAV